MLASRGSTNNRHARKASQLDCIIDARSAGWRTRLTWGNKGPIGGAAALGSPNRLELSFLTVLALPKASSTVLLLRRTSSMCFAAAAAAAAGEGDLQRPSGAKIFQRNERTSRVAGSGGGHWLQQNSRNCKQKQQPPQPQRPPPPLPPQDMAICIIAGVPVTTVVVGNSSPSHLRHRFMYLTHRCFERLAPRKRRGRSPPERGSP